MKRPNIWGPGSLFAFSGLDGQNTLKDSIVGTLCADRIGVLFHTNTKRELSFALTDIKDIRYEIVASDIIKATLLNKKTKEKLPLSIAFCAQDTVVGLTTESALPLVFCIGEATTEYVSTIQVHKTDGEYTAFAKEADGQSIKFAFSYSKQSEADAVQKAREALEIDVHALAEQKIAFFDQLPQTSHADGRVEKTLAKCFSVMKSQVYTKEGMFTSRWTTPDRLPHRKLWLWDSVFHAVGNKYISPELASDSIKAVLSTQQEDGFIPHLSFPDKSSDITQPPVLAWGLYHLYQYGSNKTLLEETYEPLKKYLEWNIAHRDVNHNHLFEWKVNPDSTSCRCDECGMDNSPRFDNVVEMDCIDFSCLMANEARVMADIAGVLGLKDEQDKWSALFAKIKHAVNEHLWDGEHQFYYDKIVESGAFKKVKAVSSFLPLFAGICEPHHAESLVKHLTDDKSFGAPFSIPSISLDDPTFGSDMWRGPVWINYNYLISLGLKEYGYHELANDIIGKTVEIITQWYQHDGVIYEFYDSMNKVSPSRLNRKGPAIEPYDFNIRYQSIRDYGWSCTLFPAMVLE